MIKKLILFGIMSLVPTHFIALNLPKITDQKVAEARYTLEKELTIKYYLAKSGYVVGAAALSTALYNAGFVDWVIGKKANGVAKAAIITQEAWAQLLQRVAALEAQKGGYFVVNLLKSIWFQGITLVAGGILVQAPIMSIFTKPDYDWIFKNRTHVLALANDAVDVANKYAYFLASKPLRAQYYKEELLNLIVNLAQEFPILIAYLECRVADMDTEEAEENNLSGMPRFLFNSFNDFSAELQTALEENNGSTVANLVKGLHSDLFTHANQCALFEKR